MRHSATFRSPRAIGLVMETISIGIIIIITAIVVGKHGTRGTIPRQLDLSAMNFGGVKTGNGFRGVQLRRLRECGDVGEGIR